MQGREVLLLKGSLQIQQQTLALVQHLQASSRR